MPVVEVPPPLPPVVQPVAAPLPIAKAMPLQSSDPQITACNVCGLLYEIKSMLRTKDGYFVCRLCAPSISSCRNCGQKIAIKDLVAIGPTAHCPLCGTFGKPALEIQQEIEFVPKRKLLELREATIWEAA